MAADHLPAQKQHWNVQPEAPLQPGIRIHVDPVDGRQPHRARKRGKPDEHLLAELAVAALNDGQSGGVWRLRADGSVSG